MKVNANLYSFFEYYFIPPLFDNLSLEAQQYGSEPSIVTDMYNYKNEIDNVINTHNEEKSNNNIEYESTKLDVLKLTMSMKFNIWKITKSYLEDCAKQEEFCFLLGVRINSIIDEHNHSKNLLIVETAPKFYHLPNDMLEKVKFWTIKGRLSMTAQYNLLAASFSNKKIDKKDLSNAIQCYKKQLKLPKDDAY
ncbi:7997_t:CDS:2 [Cetraspora pellucida]|uniref:7997_t:CDS:1 n=1 Tax=Cetraspora pellucida TaxID=1433469 RepID=A0A9N9P9K5_9GLOM|nr:7997_t:CDS:2 [Cetraspora pellucida]